MNKLKLRQMLQQFFLEDMGERDVTSESIFGEKIGQGTFIAKQNGIFSGAAVICEGLWLFHPSIKIDLYKKDGDVLHSGDIIATVKGPVNDLLSAERVILNLIQRMSGIATLTSQAVKALEGSCTKVCDTRKTTPGLRMLEKYAVTCGGGYNHRFGLYDAVMIKDNHIAFCGSITKAVQTVKERLGHMIKIEVETETLEEVLEAVKAKADVIMFDNRSPDEVKEFVKHVPPSIITEASGGITVETIGQYRDTNVNFISLGELTHSAKALDISFECKVNG
jgi:nicotinate-nucleotide pyrophosphorylase (carboxylating)